MSTQSDIISFDLSHGAGHVIDIASLYPISSVHAIRTTKPILDTLKHGQGRVYDFSLSRKLSLKRFRTLVTLDLSTPELWQPSILTKKILQIRPRFSTIDLVPFLPIPYGALDLRKEEAILTDKRYPDIYERKIPTSLHVRREWKNIKSSLVKHRRPVVFTIALFVFLTVPLLWYTKYLVEDGFAQFAQIRSIDTPSEAIDLIQVSRGDFERANILFAPFRLIPHDTLTLAGTAIESGLSLTR
jgi:hypothetical protein